LTKIDINRGRKLQKSNHSQIKPLSNQNCDSFKSWKTQTQSTQKFLLLIAKFQKIRSERIITFLRSWIFNLLRHQT